MRRLFLVSGVSALLALGLTGCPEAATNVNTRNANTAVILNNNANTMTNVDRGAMGDEKEFMTTAAQGGMAEVKLGELASTKAQNAEVKAFAQKMVTDHGKANAELKDLAKKKNFTLPTDVSEDQKETYNELAKLSGAEFDKEYVKTMVDDHEKDVDAFQKQADDGDDADTKAFAAKTLPTLKYHLEMIKKIDDKVN
ncbi:hypothetical protein BH18ACI1_BH18ACI1_05130 [soil metagenome]